MAGMTDITTTRHTTTAAQHGARPGIIYVRCNNCDWTAGPHRWETANAKATKHAEQTR